MAFSVTSAFSFAGLRRRPVATQRAQERRPLLPTQAPTSAPVARLPSAAAPRAPLVALRAPAPAGASTRASAASQSAHGRLVAQVATLGQYGGDAELGALAKVYNLAIRVWRKATALPGHFEHVATYNDAGAKTVDIVHGSAHYDALVGVKTRGRHAVGERLSVPGDGDCLFHAVAEGAGFEDLQLISAAWRHGGMDELRQNAHIMAFVDHPETLSDAQLVRELRQCFVLQMRHDVARELARPDYAAFAEHL